MREILLTNSKKFILDFEMNKYNNLNKCKNYNIKINLITEILYESFNKGQIELFKKYNLIINENNIHISKSKKSIYNYYIKNNLYNSNNNDIFKELLKLIEIEHTNDFNKNNSISYRESMRQLICNDIKHAKEKNIVFDIYYKNLKIERIINLLILSIINKYERNNYS